MSNDKMGELYQKFPPNVDWDTQTKEAMDCLIPMGITSENVAKAFDLDRKVLDEFAADSHVKAAAAQNTGKFRAEIIAIDNIDQDDGIRPSTTSETLAKLKPAFSKNGSTTAGNSSQLTDGAAAVLLMSRAEATKRRLPILGVWKSYAVEGVPPKIMGVGPVYAIPSALKKANKTIEDVDVFEINEAFASQAYYSIKTLHIDTSKVNPNGGAIALGHPLGCTGARLVVSLLMEMRREGRRVGVVSMCVGGGMGAAAVLESEIGMSAL
jgi:acetyl-CoA acyltransferase 1